MLTANIVPNNSILYHTDAKTGEVLWRNFLHLEALENQHARRKASRHCGLSD